MTQPKLSTKEKLELAGLIALSLLAVAVAIAIKYGFWYYLLKAVQQ